MKCCMPQGFFFYKLLLVSVLRRQGLNCHSYTDDTQLYIAVPPVDPGPINALSNCSVDIKSQMAEDFLQLSQDKTGGFGFY